MDGLRFKGYKSFIKEYVEILEFEKIILNYSRQIRDRG